MAVGVGAAMDWCAAGWDGCGCHTGLAAGVAAGQQRHCCGTEWCYRGVGEGGEVKVEGTGTAAWATTGLPCGRSPTGGVAAAGCRRGVVDWRGMCWVDDRLHTSTTGKVAPTRAPAGGGSRWVQ